MRYHWPGNIRELHNVLEKAVILAKSRVLNTRDLEVDFTVENEDGNKNLSTELPLYHWIRNQEREYLINKLKRFGGRIDRTAKSCGVDVRTLHRKLQVHGLDKRSFSQSALQTRFIAPNRLTVAK
jgi:DNA-binding NtrC family response regulator